MSNGNGHRWSRFWWQDWQRDEGLRLCSLAAQGLWMRLLCIAHEATPCGHVLINGKPPSIKRLALVSNATGREIIKLLAELEDAGVFSRTEDGTIYSRRMVKDAAFSEVGREAAARRWKAPKPIGQPNGSDPPNPLGNPQGNPMLEAEADSEAEAEERKVPFYINPLLPRNSVGSGTREEEAASDEILEATEGQRVEFVGPPSKNPTIAAHIRRTAKACEMASPYGHVRDRSEQTAGLDAVVQLQPPVDLPFGRLRPVDPVRSPVAMMAELLGVSLAEAALRFPHAMATE